MWSTLQSFVQVISRNWITIERIPSTGILQNEIIRDVVQSLGHTKQWLEHDWPKDYVPQKLIFVPQNVT